MSEKKILFADFGNSNAKFMSPEGDFKRFAYNDEELRTFFGQDKIKLVYSSVNPSAVTGIGTYKNIETLDASVFIANLEIINYDDIEGIGADRIFGLLGAMSQSFPPLITIDCGTAITVNVLNSQREVVGGIIMPGYKLQEFALKSGTEGLKRISISEPKELIGKNTNAAISSGIYYGIAAAVNSLIEKIKSDIFKGEKVNIFLTGGASLLILPYLHKSFGVIHDEMLVLKGIKYAYEKWLTEKN